MLKPHDIIVALKLLRRDSAAEFPTYAQLSVSVGLSASETHAAVERGLAAGLLRRDTVSLRQMPTANAVAMKEFIVHGLKYVWPSKRGPIVRGVPTATSVATIAESLDLPSPATPLVWPHPEGTMRGETVEPLYAKAAEVCLKDEELHQWLALIDIARLRGGREAALAKAEIERRLR